MVDRKLYRDIRKICIWEFSFSRGEEVKNGGCCDEHTPVSVEWGFNIRDENSALDGRRACEREREREHDSK